MYKLAFLILNLSLCHAFWNSSPLCDHDFCGPNGVCQPNSANQTYSCKCLSGARGQHCEIEDCRIGNCRMAADYCNAYPKVNCQNGGQCINTARGFRCRCPKGFEGTYCNEKKIPVYLSGDIVIALNGSKDEIVEHLDTILAQIEYVSNLTVHVQVDKKTQKPIVYSLNEGNQLENFNNADASARRSKRSVKSEEVLLVLKVEITKCLKRRRLDSNIQCPETVSSAAIQLKQNEHKLNEILNSMGIQVLLVFVPSVVVERSVEVKAQLIAVFVLTTIIVILVILIACFVRRQKNANMTLIGSECQSRISVISTKDPSITSSNCKKGQEIGTLHDSKATYRKVDNNLFEYLDV